MTSGEKTVSLLKLLGQAPYVHSVTELGEKIGCTKSGTCKLLAALVKSGLATQTVDRKYTLGPVVYILGKTYEDHIGLSKMVKPYLVRLRDLTGRRVSRPSGWLAVWGKNAPCMPVPTGRSWGPSRATRSSVAA